MLNSGKKISDQKINILTCVVRRKILNETKKPYPPPPPTPFKLNGRSVTGLSI